MEEIIYWAIGVVITLAVVAGAVMPTWHNSSTNGWDASSKTMWSIVGLVVVAVVILIIIRGVKGK